MSGSDENSVKVLLTDINELIRTETLYTKSEAYWLNTGIELLTFIRTLLASPEKVNQWTPKEYNSDRLSLLESIFIVLEHVPNPNRLLPDDLLSITASHETSIAVSIYELAFTRCSSMISLSLGDRFSFIQKLLIRNLFGGSFLRSFLASDLYIFILRIIHPHRQMAMCQIIMNLCRRAPNEALVKGAALIIRIKHPVINFENPKYQDLLEFTS